MVDTTTCANALYRMGGDFWEVKEKSFEVTFLLTVYSISVIQYVLT